MKYRLRGALILRLHGSKRSSACALSAGGLSSPPSERATLHVCIKESAVRLIISHYVLLAQEPCPPLLYGHASCETSSNKPHKGAHNRHYQFASHVRRTLIVIGGRHGLCEKKPQFPRRPPGRLSQILLAKKTAGKLSASLVRRKMRIGSKWDSHFANFFKRGG